MTWFGWLTKGHYEVSELDKLIGFGEVTAALLLFIGLVLLVDWFNTK